MEIKTLSLDLGDKIDEKMIDAIMALDGRGSILLLEKEYEWRK